MFRKVNNESKRVTLGIVFIPPTSENRIESTTSNYKVRFNVEKKAGNLTR
jgi:hypothetical protein